MSTLLKKIISGFLNLFYPLFKKLMAYSVYAYLAVGAINTALNIFLFAVLYQFALSRAGLVVNGFQMASYTIALFIAFIVTVPTGFWLTKNFAFAHVNTHNTQQGKQLGKYFLVVLQGLGSDYLILKTLIVFTSINPTVAKLISTVVVLTFNYMLQKYFTFKIKASKEY